MKENEKQRNNESKRTEKRDIESKIYLCEFRLIFNELLNTERAYVDSLGKCIQVSDKRLE